MTRQWVDRYPAGRHWPATAPHHHQGINSGQDVNHCLAGTQRQDAQELAHHGVTPSGCKPSTNCSPTSMMQLGFRR